MKKLLCFVCTLLLLMSVGVTAFAEETVLTADIPNTHMVTVKSDSGRVALDGVVCKGTATVERHREQSYRIIPDAGKQIDKVLYNGEDVTGQLKKSVFTAPKLVRDAELEVVYKNAPAAPDDKEYDVSGKVENTEGNPLPGVMVEIGDKTDVTDENGNFNIEDLPSGTHPVVITDKDGNIIGSGEITIEKSDETDLILIVDENGNPVLKPGNDTEDIGLTIVVDDDGSIRIKDAKDITSRPGGAGSPSTGDENNCSLWLAFMFASAGIIFIIFITNRRRKATEARR